MFSSSNQGAGLAAIFAAQTAEVFYCARSGSLLRVGEHVELFFGEKFGGHSNCRTGRVRDEKGHRTGWPLSFSLVEVAVVMLYLPAVCSAFLLFLILFAWEAAA